MSASDTPTGTESQPGTLEAAEEALKTAQAARDAARQAEQTEAFNRMRDGAPGYRPPVPVAPPSDASSDPTAALQIALQHLGAHPPASLAACLRELGALTSWSPDALAMRLSELSDDQFAQNSLRRASVSSDRDTALILVGLLLARL